MALNSNKRNVKYTNKNVGAFVLKCLKDCKDEGQQGGYS